MNIPKIKTVALKAPPGKYRVVGVDTFEMPGKGSYIIGDYLTLPEAEDAARANGGTMNKTYVYDSDGKVLGDFGTF
jgi:hypothetical protein